MEHKKIKVLLAITKSNMGGAQHYVFNVAKLLDKSRFAVAVLSGGRGLLQEKLEAEHVRTIAIPRMARDINLFDECAVFFSIIKILRKERPDVFHVNSSKMGGLGALAGRIAGVPHIIFTVHGWYFNEDRSKLIKLVTYLLSWITGLLSHTVITVSKKDYAQGATMPFVKNKLILCYPGIPEQEFYDKETAQKALVPNPEEHKDDFWLGTIAEFTKNKNIPNMVQAVHAYNKNHTPKIFFSIIGEKGEEREIVDALVKNLGAENYISVIGYKDHAAQYLGAYNGFILASRKEGFPTVLLEAGRAGLTVLTSAVGGIPELIKDNETGLLLAGTSEKAIEKGLERLTQTTLPLGESLRRVVSQFFSLQKMVEATEQIYTKH